MLQTELKRRAERSGLQQQKFCGYLCAAPLPQLGALTFHLSTLPVPARAYGSTQLQRLRCNLVLPALLLLAAAPQRCLLNTLLNACVLRCSQFAASWGHLAITGR